MICICVYSLLYIHLDPFLFLRIPIALCPCLSSLTYVGIKYASFWILGKYLRKQLTKTENNVEIYVQLFVHFMLPYM